MRGTQGFTASELWAPFSFSWSICIKIYGVTRKSYPITFMSQLHHSLNRNIPRQLQQNTRINKFITVIILWYHHNNTTTKFTCTACTFAFFLRGGTSTLISFSSSKLYSSITSRETNPSMSPEKNVGSSNTTGVHFRFLVFLFLSVIVISVLFHIQNKSTPYTLLSGEIIFLSSAIRHCGLLSWRGLDRVFNTHAIMSRILTADCL